MNKNLSKKGFTIIELLVVIAIIAVLAAIVLVNVTKYINKGKDAAIQGNLASVITNAAVAIDGGATDVCANPTITAAITAAKTAYGDVAGDTAFCKDAATTDTAWAACSQLKDADSYFCVDSTGKKSTVATKTGCTSLAFTVSACP